MLKRFLRPFYLIAGLLTLAIGIIGIFVPLLPTTPFVLLAAFCFSKGSERLHKWLLNHKLFGDIIQNWERYGVIRSRVKWVSTILIIIMLSYPIGFLAVPLIAKITAGVIGVCVILFIQTRPGTKDESLKKKRHCL